MANRENYSSMEMHELETIFDDLSRNHGRWVGAAIVWQSMGTKLRGAQDNVNHAWSKADVFNENEQAGDSDAYRAFADAIQKSNSSILGESGWAPFAENVGQRLFSTARIIADNRSFFETARSAYYAAEEGSAARKEAEQWARLFVWNVANAVQLTFAGLKVPTTAFEGPMGAGAQGEQPGEAPGGVGDPGGLAAGGGAPGGGGTGGGDLGAPPGGQPPGAPGENPGDKPGDEPPDPLDQAGKFIDVAGKGIDLLGKPADVAGKYLGLAEQLKGLGGDGGGAPDEQDLEDLFPDIPDPKLPEDPKLPDNLDNLKEPSLAGGTSTAPSFTPPDLGTGTGGAGGGAGAGTAGLGGFGAAGGYGRTGGGEAAGAGGQAPSLAGRSTSGGGPSPQSGMPPMYPPMGGMGAGAPGGQGEIKPGQAQSRPGFDVAREPTRSEQLRRQGVQQDLQGRTSGEQRSAPAARTRRRKDSGRTRNQPDQGVLDEELWRL